MPDIGLKDKSGTTVIHEGVTQIKAQHYSSGSQNGSSTFTHMPSLKCYCLKRNGDGTYLVTRVASRLNLPDIYMFEVTDTQCREYGHEYNDGTYGLITVLSLKTLTVGESYTVNEMY